MNIELMVNLKNNLSLPNTVAKSEGLTINEIETLEQKYNNGKKLPKAFREYLFLAGEYFNGGLDTLGEGLDQLQEYAKEDLKKTKQKVDKPFFAFHVYDGLYSVIFLDEINEDPKVYMIDPFKALERSTLVSIPKGGFKENYTFTELVNESIRRVKNNISF